MFSKAPRFPPERPSDVPGPNAYSVPSPPRAKAPSMVIASHVPRRVEVTATHQPPPQPLGARSVNVASGTGGADKEKEKLERKLEKAQKALQEKEEQLVESKREKEDLAVELRLAAQKRAKLEASLAKASSAPKLASLQSSLHTLEELHTRSKADAAALLEASRRETAEQRQAAQAARREADDAVRTGARLSAELDEVQREMQQLESKQLKGAEQRLRAVGEERDAALQRKEAACDELQSVQEELDAALAAVEESQDELSQAEQRASLLSRAGCELGARLHASQLGAASLQLLNAAYRHENATLRARLQEVSDEEREWQARRDLWTQERESLEAQLDEAHSEGGPSYALDIAPEAEAQIAASAAPELDGLAEVLQLAAESRASLLSDEVAALRQMSTEQREATTALRLALSAAEAEQQRLASAASERSVALQRAEREALRAVTAEQQIVALQTREKETRLEMERLKESNKALSGKVGSARAKEERWSDEVEELAAALTRATAYEEAYAQLSLQHTHLLSRFDDATTEASVLASLNASLAGHANSAQRILYVDRLRVERDEARHEMLALRLERDAAQQAQEELQKKLECFTAIDVPLHERPRTKVTRVRRLQRPLGATMPSLAQREAEQQQQPLAASVAPTSHALSPPPTQQPTHSTPAPRRAAASASTRLPARRTPIKVAPLRGPLRRSLGGSRTGASGSGPAAAEWLDEPEPLPLRPLTPGRAALGLGAEGEMTLDELCGR